MHELGIDERRIRRWDRGVDLTRFDPEMRVEGLFAGEINVFYAGRLTTEKGVELLADAFLAARRQDPRLHLVLAGGGPEEAHAARAAGRPGDVPRLAQRRRAAARVRVGGRVPVRFSRPIRSGRSCSRRRHPGLPVAAVGVGGPASLISDGETGMLAGPSADELAAALLAIIWTPLLAQRLRKNALAAVRDRSWEGSLVQLAAGYRTALLRAGDSGRGVRVA